MLRPIHLFCLLAALCSAARMACGQALQPLHLEFQTTWGETPVRLEDSWHDAGDGTSVRLARVDFLLSGLALQREDGSWLESENWHAAIRTGTRAMAVADGLPPGKYRAIRFQVGLNATDNGSDPASYAPDHPLNPNVNGLHWDLMGGYIFMAFEGHWRRNEAPDAVLPGFSWHLARDGNTAPVELPVAMTGGSPLTVSIRLDAARLFSGPQKVSLLRDAASTHSRAGDPLVAKLRENLSAAFSVTGMSRDVFQPATATASAGTKAPAGTTPRALKISQRLPQVALPSDNPLTMEGTALGSRLFSETLLSVNNKQSCASCHQQARAFADAAPFSVGAEGFLSRRSAMPLFNLAWSPKFFWDGRAPTLRQQVLQPILDAHEMNEQLDRVTAKLSAHPEYSALFRAAFGTDGITPDRIALALEQHLLTLVSQDSRYDRAVRRADTLTNEEKIGLQLFTTEHDPARGLRGADCFHCHGGTLFTTHIFADNGLPPRPGVKEDLGLGEITRKESDHRKFKAPSLRNIALTAPYMHDNRFATLEEVVEYYNSGVHRYPTLDPNLAKHPAAGLGLSAAEKKALVAFLRTLTDEAFTGDGDVRESENGK